MQADGVRREVLACLTHGATPFSLHARLLETAKAEGVLTELGEVLPDVLLDLVLLVRPAPPLLFEYLDVLCLDRARYMGENTCDAGRVIVVLLRKINATVDQDTLSTLCQHILDAVGDAPIWTNHFIQRGVASTESFLSFWHAALHLMQAEGPSSELCRRLIAGAALQGWPGLDDIPLRHTVLEAWQNIPLTQNEASRQAVATLRQGLSVITAVDDLFDEHPAAQSPPNASLWKSPAFFTYATSLQRAWRQAETSGGRHRPLLPTSGAPEPETVLLIHGLSDSHLHWHRKYLSALGLLQARLLHAIEPPHDVGCAFVLEMLVAMAQAATVQLRTHASERHALLWRHIIGGVMPPLVAFLSGSVPSSHRDGLVMRDMIACFVHMYDPIRDWIELDECVMATSTHAVPLPTLILASFATWDSGLHAGPVSLESLPLHSNAEIHSFSQAVRTALGQHPESCGALLAQALQEPRLQLVIANEFSHLFTEWSESLTPDLAHVHAVCLMLEPHVPRVLDMLHLYIDKQKMAHALVRVLSRIEQRMWQDHSELASIGRVILFLQYLSYYIDQTGIPSSGYAYIFMTRNMSSINMHAFPEQSLSLITRWCRCLVEGQAITDDLLAVSPPWTMYRITPTILSLLLEAHMYSLLDDSALFKACSYFLQVPLAYNVPCAVQWLVQFASSTLAKSQYDAKLLSHVVMYVRVIHKLLTSTSDVFSPLYRSILAHTVLPLLTNERLILVLSTSEFNLPSFIMALESMVEPRLTKYEWISDVLMQNEQGRLWAGLAKYVGHLTHEGLQPGMAQQLLKVALHTTEEHTWATKLIAAMFAMVYPYDHVTVPLSLARVTLFQWDAHHAKAEHVIHLSRIIGLSIVLVKHMPGHEEGLPAFLDSLPAVGTESFSRLLRLDA